MPKGIFFFKKVVVGELKNRVRESHLNYSGDRKLAAPLHTNTMENG